MAGNFDYNEAEDPQTPEERTAAAARSGSPNPESSVWDSDEALEGLKMERAVQGDEDAETQTKRLLKEAGPAAAASIIHIALHSANDNTRLNAAKYITDKFYDDGAGNAAAAWEDLVANVIDTAELVANMPQNPGN